MAQLELSREAAFTLHYILLENMHMLVAVQMRTYPQQRDDKLRCYTGTNTIPTNLRGNITDHHSAKTICNRVKMRHGINKI